MVDLERRMLWSARQNLTLEEKLIIINSETSNQNLTSLKYFTGKNDSAHLPLSKTVYMTELPQLVQKLFKILKKLQNVLYRSMLAVYKTLFIFKTKLITYNFALHKPLQFSIFSLLFGQSLKLSETPKLSKAFTLSCPFETSRDIRYRAVKATSS